jgi:cell division protease FtsH
MNLRNLVIWGIVVVALIGIYSMVTGGGHATGASEISYSQLLSKVDAGQVKSAVFRGSAVEVRDSANHTYTAVTLNNQDDLAKSMKAQNVDMQVKPAGGFTLLSFILNSLPILLLIGVWIFFMRQMQGGARAWAAATTSASRP